MSKGKFKKGRQHRGRKLKALMVLKGLTAAEVAEHFSVTPDYVRQICRDERKADLLRVKIYEFLRAG